MNTKAALTLNKGFMSGLSWEMAVGKKKTLNNSVLSIGFMLPVSDVRHSFWAS